MPEPELRVLDRPTVEQCIASLDPLDVVEAVLREHGTGNTVLAGEAYMEWANQADAYCRSIAMPGGVLADGKPIYGMKVINAAVSNPALGLDRAGGITMLFDPETARPCLIADAGYLSAVRTAAYTLVSLRHLGPQEYESVSVLGCGALAREHLRMLAQHRPDISTIYVYDINPDRTDALQIWAAQHLPASVVAPCATAHQAVAATTVLFTLTTSRQPYIEQGWFRPASFVAHVSLDDVTEEVFLGAEAVFVDDMALVRDNPRRILGRLMAEGKLCEPARPGKSRGQGPEIAGTLGDVLAGRQPAIRPREGVVVSNPFGMSILDIALLQRVAQTAAKEGLGQSLQMFGGKG